LKKCKKCNDTGRLSRGRYCDCREGAFVRAKDKLEEEAKTLVKTIKQTPEVKPEKPKPKLNVKVGDWVEHGSVIGVVGAIDDIYIRFIPVRYKDGTTCDYEGSWIKGESKKPLPIETFDEATPFLIDLALMTKDEEWFYELTGGKKK
jgi:IDEAL domain